MISNRGHPISPTPHWSDTPLVRHPIGPTPHWSDTPLVPLVRPPHWSDTPLVQHPIGPTPHWSDTPLVRHPIGPTDDIGCTCLLPCCYVTLLLPLYYPVYITQTVLPVYFIQILTGLSHLIKLYLRSKSPTTEPQFTTALRDVKESLSQGSGVN